MESKNIALIINLFICVIILFSLNKDISLPTIGIIHKSVSNRGNKALRLNKQEYISIPFSFIAFLVGFIDGDGTFSTNKFVPRFKLENHIKELELYNKIKEFISFAPALFHWLGHEVTAFLNKTKWWYFELLRFTNWNIGNIICNNEL